MKIILASGSPRRKELLEQAGYNFTIEVSDADENIKESCPAALVEELSRRKARAVAGKKCREAKKADKRNGGADKINGIERNTGGIGDRESIEKNAAEEITVIGADTVVALNETILGKPKQEEEAVRMLRELSGKTHQVYTGVSLLLIRKGEIAKEETFSVCTSVTMRRLADEEIRRYVSTKEPMDKAGAYGIQGQAAVFISEIQGDYYNVVGLPLCETVCRLRQLWGKNEGE